LKGKLKEQESERLNRLGQTQKAPLRGLGIMADENRLFSFLTYQGA